MEKKYCHIFLFVLLNFIVLISVAQDHDIDSLLKRLKMVKTDTGKIDLLNDIGNRNWKQGNYDSAFKYNNEALSEAQHIHFTRGIADAYTNLGIIYKYRGNYRSALEYYNKALKLFGSLGNDKGKANSFNNIGIVYRYMGNYPVALKNHLAALKLREKMKDSASIAASDNNIGLVYFDQYDTKDARERYFAALAIFKNSGNKRALGDCYANIGGTYEYEGKYSEAVKYHLLSLEFRKAANNKKGVADCYNNLGLTYFAQGDSAYNASGGRKNVGKNLKYEEAKNSFLTALQLKEALHDKQGLADTYNNLGPLFIKLNDFSSARSVLTHSLAIAAEIRNMDDISTAYYGMSQLDSAQGNFKQALISYRSFIIYRDSLNNDESTKKSVQMMMQFDFDKMQAADSIKNAEVSQQEQLKHDQEIKQQKIYTYGGVIGFILMLIVAGVSLRAYTQKQNANRIISRQKELVEEKQKEILDSIHYAKRIQRSLLPTEKYIFKNLERLRKRTC